MSADRERRVWVLNLDAEHELEVRGSYTPSRHLEAIVRRERRRLLETLIAPDDVVLLEEADVKSGRAVDLPGLAWSPTRSALARLERAGARPVATPDVECLRSVNARPFAAGVRAALPGLEAFEKRVVSVLDEVLAALARPAAEGWLVRRTFGASGRGRRRIAAGSPDAAERAWLEASLRTGPLIVEPWVHVTREHTRSGWVERDGTVHVAAPCFQAVTREGAWTTTEAADVIDRDEDARLEEAFRAAGSALAESGYFGPFGIDAFRYRTAGPGSPELLNPLSEINARLTMDWTTGMVDGQAALARAAGIG